MPVVHDIPDGIDMPVVQQFLLLRIALNNLPRQAATDKATN